MSVFLASKKPSRHSKIFTRGSNEQYISQFLQKIIMGNFREDSIGPAILALPKNKVGGSHTHKTAHTYLP